jgi:DNA mismatch endonuclease, patch repair protein
METPDVRHRTMQAVRSKNTGPEMCVRRMLRAQGYRYRLHRRDLPGCPDLVFSGRKKIIFIHGCFWHGHDCARGARVPVQNRDYWTRKVARNKARDQAARETLTALGWDVVILWECEIRDKERTAEELRKFLGRAA